MAELADDIALDTLLEAAAMDWEAEFENCWMACEADCAACCEACEADCEAC